MHHFLSCRGYGFACFVATTCISGTIHAATIGSGSLTDPVGDTNYAGAKDLMSADILVDSLGTLKITIAYAPGIPLGDAWEQVSLDTDQNSATGYPGIDAANTDASLIGVDYIIEINGSDYAPVANVKNSSSILLGSFPVSYTSSTVETEIPLSILGGDDGNLNFKVGCATQITASSFTGVQDYMSNPGEPVGVVTLIPEPSSLALLSASVLGCIIRRR